MVFASSDARATLAPSTSLASIDRHSPTKTVAGGAIRIDCSAGRGPDARLRVVPIVCDAYLLESMSFCSPITETEFWA